MDQAQLLGRIIGAAFDLGDLCEIKLHFANGRQVERSLSAKSRS